VLTVGSNPGFFCGKYCTYASYTNPAGGVVLGTNPPQTARQITTDNSQTFRGGGVSGNAVFKLSDDLNLTSITAYRTYTSSFGTDDDYTPTLTGGAGGNNTLDHHFFSEELRLNGKIGSFADFTVGGYFSKQRTTYYTLQDIRYIIPGTALQFYGDDPVDAESKAVFGTVIAHPLEGLTLTGGLRYTKESKDYQFVRRNLDGSINSFLDPIGAAYGAGYNGPDTLNIAGGGTSAIVTALNGTTARYKGQRLDYRASIDYRFSPALMAYATISTGFKGGGVSARPFDAQQALEGNFEPETLTAYEIGLKSDLLDRALRINLSAFVNSYKNVQLPISDCSAYGGGPCGVVTNAGDSRFHGVEVEVTAQPVTRLSFDGSMSYLDAKWNELDPRVGTSVSMTNPATTAPKWKLSAGLQYEATLGDAGSLTPRIDASYTDKRFNDQTINLTPYYLPSYTLVNGRVTWRNVRKDLDISAEVTNMFNEYYYTARFEAVYAYTQTAYSELGRPREWQVTIKKKL
jgi:iron complex outermembrane receptor protein